MANDTFKSPLRRILGRYYTAVGFIFLLLGILLRLYAIGKIGFWWDVIRDIGSFIVIAFAIPFFYERLIKAEERQLFLADVAELLDRKLPHNTTTLKIHEAGRLKLDEKVAFLQQATSHILVLGTASRSFVGYFDQRPAHEFKDHIVHLLQRGVNINCVLLDPNWDGTKRYAQDRQEPELLQRIEGSIRSLQTLSNEFKQQHYAGQLQIQLYQHYPEFTAISIDGDTSQGALLISHYLLGVRRAEGPSIMLTKSGHPVMFATYWKAIKHLTAS